MLKRSLAVGARSGASAEDCQRACQAALQLLARSVQNGHRRLALIRLGDAVRVGAQVQPEYWRYCEAVAADGTDADLRALFLAAQRQHALRRHEDRAAVAPIPGFQSQLEGM
ncbi:hypothetical protein [Denitromonas sp.]|jgi:hypothetical protein|uniref:hypothetical protein n=1 Tax=Denitromonas sp. TaxID=2734609 RepID=UPI002A3AF286|nr:hypothetical protein [Denitromonas sp.]MDX9717615.1 hypothetical protein [Thauera sp.]